MFLNSNEHYYKTVHIWWWLAKYLLKYDGKFKIKKITRLKLGKGKYYKMKISLNLHFGQVFGVCVCVCFCVYLVLENIVSVFTHTYIEYSKM